MGDYKKIVEYLHCKKCEFPIAVIREGEETKYYDVLDPSVKERIFCPDCGVRLKRENLVELGALKTWGDEF